MDHPLPGLSPPPYLLYAPHPQTTPVVFASPHSGRVYPPEFLALARLDPLELRRSEDSFVDELFAAAPTHGAPLLAAHFPRAYCDPNREAWELDPAMFEDPLPPWVNTKSPRVAAGLGTVPRVVALGEAIYRNKLAFADAEARVQGCWEPYHAALAGLIERTRDTFGACLLIDCHSMPGSPPTRDGGADVVLGDVHGTACSSRLTRLVETALAKQGLTVRRNDPYAGGYVTRHYGRPREGVHALQIELARRLYMDEERIAKTPGFAQLAARLSGLIEAVCRDAPGALRTA